VEILRPAEEDNPAVDMPPVKVEVPAPLIVSFPPEAMTSPVEITRPAEEESPAEEIPPLKVEVPVLRALMSPENKASPVEILRPAEEDKPAEESPPVKVEVPAPPETILPVETKRSPEEITAPLEKEGETAVVEPNTAPMLVAKMEPPVMVRPDWVERPPLVEIEMPPEKEEVAVPLTAKMLSVESEPTKDAAPLTPKTVPGVLVAMPMKPFWLRTIKEGVEVPSSETTNAPKLGLLEVMCSTDNTPQGEEVAMPTLAERLEEPLTCRPPARIVSPAETLKPLAVDWSPAAAKPPLKVVVAVLVMLRLPANLAAPNTSKLPVRR
jgi:hypothetical protein